MHRNITNTLAALYAASLFAVPFFVHAAPNDFAGFVALLINLVNDSIVPLIFALAFVSFIWGVLKYFFFPSEANKKTGRDFIVWGLLGMFIMASVWGLVNITAKTLFP